MTAEDKVHLDKLLIKLVDEKLTEAERKDLDTILEKSREARSIYNDYIDIHVALDWQFGNQSLNLPSGLESLIESAPKTEAKLFYYVAPFLTLAAIIAIILFIPNQFKPIQPVKNHKHYTVQNQLSAKWNGQNFEAGEMLKDGKYMLESGYSELLTKNGVKLILEGPVEFELESAKKVNVIKGNLVAYVPDESIGFEVTTPKTRILDLGTEFAVSVAESGDTEVHVMEGLVETTTGNSKDLLNVNKARIISASGTQDIEADATRFMRILPEPESDKPIKYIHWSFDEGNGDFARFKGRKLRLNHYNAHFKREENKQGPQWVEGKFGSAVYFDGNGSFLQTAFPGIGGSAARTVCFWVKIPEKSTLNNAISMLAWGSYEGKGRTWQVTWNWVKENGNIGALRAGLYHGQIVGTNDLRDGQWHHVAVVMYGGKRANVNTHILLYVDGELEHASRKSILEVKTDINSEKSTPLIMGKGAMSHIQQLKYSKYFKGSMDEVYVFYDALSQNQIKKIMYENQAP